MIDSYYLPDWSEDWALNRINWSVFDRFLLQQTFGVEGENSIKSCDDSWSIPPQFDRNRVSMQGDHEELKILLKNCLIPSRFN